MAFESELSCAAWPDSSRRTLRTGSSPPLAPWPIACLIAIPTRVAPGPILKQVSPPVTVASPSSISPDRRQPMLSQSGRFVISYARSIAPRDARGDRRGRLSAGWQMQAPLDVASLPGGDPIRNGDRHGRRGYDERGIGEKRVNHSHESS